MLKPSDSKAAPKAPITIQEATPKYVSSSSKQAIKDIDQLVVTKDGGPGTKNATAAVIAMATGTDNIPLTVDNQGNPITPFEAVANIPEWERDSIINICQGQISEAQANNNGKDVIFWQNVNNTFSRPDQPACIGKSYGDPHMRTYDGYTYDLMSVGEFVLTKAANSNFEIQTRQTSTNGRISLNSAVAMNVNSDRVCIYTQGFPDAFTTIPLRVNGDPLDLKVYESFALLNGGVIRRESNQSYRISWPTGEQALVKFFGSQSRLYMNVLPQVFAAGNHGMYLGLLGNADGIPSNDLTSKFGQQTSLGRHFYSLNTINNGQSVSRTAQKDEAKFNKSIINNFGESWRVSSYNSLFDYAYGKNTYSFKQNTKAKNVATLANLPENDVKAAKKACEEAGITDTDVLRGCTLDVAASGDLELAKAIADVENDEDIATEMKLKNKLNTSLSPELDKE